MKQQLNAGLKDIFSTILKDHQGAEGGRPLPPIIVLNGNGNVIAPGGTVHLVQARPPGADPQES